MVVNSTKEEALQWYSKYLEWCSAFYHQRAYLYNTTIFALEVRAALGPGGKQ